MDKSLRDQIRDTLEAEGFRTFDSGAKRDTDHGKLDFEGFLSPVVLQRFAEYMHQNRTMSDGSLRASDDWQLGMPQDEYMKSVFRHFMELWSTHRGVAAGDKQEILCALMFNVMGYLYEELTR